MDISSSSSSSPEPSERRPVFGNRRRRSNADYGDALSAQYMMSSGQNLDIFRWEDDDIALRCAAANARLPYDCLSAKELEFFPDVAKSRTSTNLYLFLRNKTVQLWQIDPLVELTFDAVRDEIPPPFNSDSALLKRVHQFLQRYGYINFGVFMNLSHYRLENPRKIIVIGAGAAGLLAARQLNFMGFEVQILEARPRTGGRVMTYRRSVCAADLGAMIIMGITGNPVITLTKQLPVHLSKINGKCPIYDFNGKLVDPRKDDMIQKAYNKLLGTCSYIAHELNITEISGRKLSLGETYDYLLKQQEYRIQKKRLNYWKTMHDLYSKLQQKHKELLICKTAVDSAYQTLSNADITLLNADLDMLESDEDFKEALRLRCLRSDLTDAIKLYEACDGERKKLDTALKELKTMEPSQVYMNATDKRILDFHFANLEYGNAAPLHNIALKDWDQDDIYEFEGCHLMIKEGYGGLLDQLTKDLEISLSHIVEKVEYDDSGVKVTCNVQGKPVLCEADAVICTAPLGVLKRSVIGQYDALKFDPPLPQWKTKAIQAMGYGNLNKIALLFERPFWDLNLNMFGRLNETSSSRGEMFLFFSNGDSPVLIGLMAGESASTIEKVNEEHLIAKAMNILTTIFPQCPRKPLDCVVTLWHIDRFARGCYSYIGVNACGDDYDRLADPICDQNGIPRVLFAGEHTHRHYPATVHGAMLSGIREAGRIADTFIGALPTYSDSPAEVAQVPPSFDEQAQRRFRDQPYSPRKEAKPVFVQDRALRAARRAAAREEKKDNDGKDNDTMDTDQDAIMLQDEEQLIETATYTEVNAHLTTEFSDNTVQRKNEVNEKIEVLEELIEGPPPTAKDDSSELPTKDDSSDRKAPKESKATESGSNKDDQMAGLVEENVEVPDLLDDFLENPGDGGPTAEHYDKQVEQEILDSD